MLIFFHILEYWVLNESRIPLKQVLGGVRIVELSNSSHEQSLLFSYIVGLTISEGFVFPDYLSV